MLACFPCSRPSLLGAIGITGSGALARTLSPVAEPLFIGSAILVILGSFACSRLVTVISITGVGLLYLSMFQLASNRSSNGGPMSMMGLQGPHHASPYAEPVSFYVGFALLLSAFVLSIWRRRRRSCRPLVRLPRLVSARL